MPQNKDKHISSNIEEIDEILAWIYDGTANISEARRDLLRWRDNYKKDWQEKLIKELYKAAMHPYTERRMKEIIANLTLN